MLHIFSFLDAISLCKVRRVCQAWNYLSTDEIMWKHKLMTDVRSWKYISSTHGLDVGKGQSDLSKVDL